ncbi:putative pentatricopeptide repeat-containing protein At1g56570 [Cryptomeria japonica]|uniref:putative pentatricopeptide repeat-containing protein At1g56570 n=1 Tax=Cryptomeria japonica TaxID=3369 RepID=UPI0027D9FB42|nr:putative pentatricopeptide repeat-containing protein At1g56570 [Cryptomeria japonica]
MNWNLKQRNSMQFWYTRILRHQLSLSSFIKTPTNCQTVAHFCKTSTTSHVEVKPGVLMVNSQYMLEDLYSSLLLDCTRMKALEDGLKVHAHMLKSGFNHNTSVNNKLLNMYVKCGSMIDAHKVFDEMPRRDIVAWNSAIAGYVHHGKAYEALNLFTQMQRLSIKPDEFTFGSVLKACSFLMDLEFGEFVYAYIIKSGFESEEFVSCGLVCMYSKCAEMENARKVFDKMPHKDLVVFNAMIAGYGHNGYDVEALQLCFELQQTGLEPDPFSLSCILSVCANLGAIEEGKSVHAHIIKTEAVLDTTVVNALITMYAKSGSLDDALKVFDKIPKRNAISWNAIIAGCAYNENNEETRKLFSQMQNIGMKPNQFTFAGILRSSTSVFSLEQGKQVHVSVVKRGLESDVIVSSALLDMYAKCAKLEDARLLFETMLKRNTVSWSTMISTYAQKGQSEQAVKLFTQMQLSGMEPNQFTFASLLMACASLASFKGGTQIHAYTLKGSYRSDVSVGNSLVDMYAKCGSIVESRKVFDRMPYQDVVSWTAMVVGYSQHGQGREAVQLFEKMQWMGMKPDQITFVGVISACSHAGLVYEGIHYFISMSEDYGIAPREEHYNCVVDLLSRAGLLEHATAFLYKMPFKPAALVWGSLLAACRIHGNMVLAKHAAEHLIELEPHRSGSYVQLSNIYAAAGRWEDKAKVIKLMKEKGVKKETGKSWIDIMNKVHTFSTGDRTHPQAEQIYAKLAELTEQMKQAGYVPNTNFEAADDTICESSAG